MRARAFAVLAISLAILAQAAVPPTPTLAKKPSHSKPTGITTTITPVPGPVGTGNASVTAGQYLALDVAINNGSKAVSGFEITDSVSLPSGSGPLAYMGTLIVGGTAAGHTTCSVPDPNGTTALHCSVGTLAASDDLHLRVIYLTPATPGSLCITLVRPVAAPTTATTPTTTGVPSASSPSQQASQHHEGKGDKDDKGHKGNKPVVLARVTIDLVAAFVNEGDAQASGYIPLAGDDLQTSLSNFGPANPIWTRVTVPAAAVANTGFGTTASIEEGPNTSFQTSGGQPVACPLSLCYGQTSQIKLADGATLPAAFRVEIRVDGIGAHRWLWTWTIAHILDDGSAESLWLTNRPCLMIHGAPAYAPCLQSKRTAPDDCNDFIAVLWLNRNGWIRNG